MFSRGNQDKKNDSTIVDELVIEDIDEATDMLSVDDVLKMDDTLPTDLEEDDSEQIATVKLVEKISGILSPYFIVLVGLYLYDDNFFFGSILILVGILSLLQISYQDIWRGVDKIKNLLIQDNSIE